MVADRYCDPFPAGSKRSDLYHASGGSDPLHSGRFGRQDAFYLRQKLWKHAEEAISSVERLEKIMFFDADAVPSDSSRMTTLSAVEETGSKQGEIDNFEELLDQVKTDDLGTIIYTSGTTGEPKGVMLKHESFVSNIIAISKGLPIKNTDRSLAVLPLSHIFERTVFYVLCANGVAIHYCAAFDQIAGYLAEVKPTIMTAVPRLFEQVYHKIVKKGKAAGGFKTKLFEWSLDIGQQYWEAKDKGESVSAVLAAKQAIASRL